MLFWQVQNFCTDIAEWLCQILNKRSANQQLVSGTKFSAVSISCDTRLIHIWSSLSSYKIKINKWSTRNYSIHSSFFVCQLFIISFRLTQRNFTSSYSSHPPHSPTLTATHSTILPMFKAFNSRESYDPNTFQPRRSTGFLTTPQKRLLGYIGAFLLIATIIVFAIRGGLGAPEQEEVLTVRKPITRAKPLVNPQ